MLQEEPIKGLVAKDVTAREEKGEEEEKEERRGGGEGVSGQKSVADEI